MTTKEAIRAMLDGQKVRLQEWDKIEYVHIADDGHIRDEKERLFAFTSANTYEIYKEPKPKETVTIEKWLCKNINQGSHFIFDVEKGETILYFEKVKLLDTYEV